MLENTYKLATCKASCCAGGGAEVPLEGTINRLQNEPVFHDTEHDFICLKKS